MDVPEHFPDKISDDVMHLTTSASESPARPSVRASFQLERVLPGVSQYKPKYGEKVYIAVYIPVWDKKVPFLQIEVIVVSFL